MKNTKALILETALRLFNQEGLAKTTLRSIAKEMNISQGNLNYHFKKREEIVEALYHQLVGEMDEFMQRSAEGPFDLKNLYQNFRESFASFYTYRFFMMDFVTIMRGHDSIRHHYQQLTELRKMQFQGLFVLLIEQKVLRQEEFLGEYENLQIRMQILSDFWLSSEIIQNAIQPEAIDRYSQAIFQSFYPYLTAKGKREFKKELLN